MSVVYTGFFGLIFLLNWSCILNLASWFVGLEQWLENRFQGKPTAPLHFRRLMYLNGFYVQRSKLWSILFSSLSFLPVLALSIELVLAIMTPGFASGLFSAFKIDNFFLISYFLMALPFLMLLSGVEKPAFMDLKKLQFFLFDNVLFLPSLFIVGVILQLTINDVSLGKIVVFFNQSASFPIMAYCPLLVSAFSMFLMTWSLLDLRDSANIKCLRSSDKLLYAYAYDIQFLIMLSLISLFIWPNSLVYFDTHHMNILVTLRRFIFAFLAWITKIVFECGTLAFFRSMYPLTTNVHKAGLAFIISIVSIIIYFTGLK